MSDQKDTFVKFVILSPFGKLPNRAGPFTQKEATTFVDNLRKLHKEMLLEADVQVQNTASDAE